MEQLLETPPTLSTQQTDGQQHTSPRQARKRGAGYSDAETSSLLDLLEMHLPISRNEWEYVAYLHSTAYLGDDITTNSLKRKLHRKRIPTGYPNIPTNVLHAKHVRMEMTRWATLKVPAGRVDVDSDARVLAMMRLSLEQERQRADEQIKRWEEGRH
ncbi:hypothetical protein GN244_ATG11119 [Phytophthora infestans]|uniref:Uncharacterized protein n=1 Tax=Phytophthora infestans TaxID=4787 RepID=A0A833WBW8_PHYIN|nr:hypothetical protein GN244_ATG11119 [Phytophthora infestans]